MRVVQAPTSIRGELFLDLLVDDTHQAPIYKSGSNLFIRPRKAD